MKSNSHPSPASGFTLMETVIAIGVLAVLLTAFLAVFTPAAQGIRKAISAQEADRLAFTLERELVTLRQQDEDYATGFDKAYDWIEASNNSQNALLIYQYRGNPSSLRADGTMEPYTRSGGVAGTDFIVQPVVRRKDATEALEEDLKALEGRVYTVKMTQLVFNESGELVRGTPGTITDPTPQEDGGAAGGTGADGYPEAYIAFSAEFYQVPNSTYSYIQSKLDLATLENPIFTRNLAVRR